MNRNHATALYNVRSCKDLIKTDKEFKNKYLILFKTLNSLESDNYKYKRINIPRVIHPGFLRYADKKSIRKVFNKGGQAPK